jgi:uncharacterized protein
LGNKIVHFELPVSDSEKIERFYSDLFGWKFEKQNMPGMDYWMIRTTGSQDDLAGGMYRKMDESERPRFYVQVDEIDAHTERLKQAGGLVLVEKAEIPGMGWSLLAKDPEGNTLGLFQPLSRPRATRSRPKTSSSKKKKSRSSSSSKRKKTKGKSRR